MKSSAGALQVFLFSMKSYEHLCCRYEPVAKKVFILRLTAFKPCILDQFPSVLSILDGISRQIETEAMTNVYGFAEDGLHQTFTVNMSTFVASSNVKD